MPKLFAFVLFSVTVLFGTVGYIIAGETSYQAFVSSFFMLIIGASVDPSNVFVEVARWTGTAFALSVVYAVLEAALAVTAESYKIYAVSRHPKAMAVHGDGIHASKLVAVSDAAVLSDRPAAFKLPCQVLLFSSDEKAVEFYGAHSAQLAHAEEVYIGLESIFPESLGTRQVYPFSMADVCAELYWESNPVYSCERIALVGDDCYAEALLSQALLTNIFSIAGGVEYVVFGDFSLFQNLHLGLTDALNLNNDSLIFESAPWSTRLPMLENCSRIILCGQSDASVLGVALQLRFAGVRSPIHARCDSVAYLNLVNAEADIKVFGTSEQLCTSAIVVQQNQHDAGKICHASYRMGTSRCNGCAAQPALQELGIIDEAGEQERNAEIKRLRLSAADYSSCLKCPGFISEWESLNDFTRKSNYAVAAHDHQKLRLLKLHHADMNKSFNDLPIEVRDELQEIEHIRWSRFHYLNNWRYGAGGKDSIQRTHHYLAPYSTLDRAVKDLDADSYHTVVYRRRDKRALAVSCRS